MTETESYRLAIEEALLNLRPGCSPLLLDPTKPEDMDLFEPRPDGFGEPPLFKFRVRERGLWPHRVLKLKINPLRFHAQNKGMRRLDLDARFLVRDRAFHFFQPGNSKADDELIIN